MSNQEHGPAAGWGSVRGILSIARLSTPRLASLDALRRMNKPGGLMCPSCAWPKPAQASSLEICENGAKAVFWELTSSRCTPAFFAEHTVTELRSWTDHDLEARGRLTHPMVYDASLDRYVETTWAEAFAGIGAVLRGLDPDAAVFYASGHAALEASYLYGLFARLYGTNNLPQSSNMCHETTSVGLMDVIGSSVGTIIWEDLEQADAFFFFGQNPGTNSPRFLKPLKAAKARGATIVTFNPVREPGLISFLDPQSPVEMLTRRDTKISDQYHQLRAGGDVAAILGMCKHVVEADDRAVASGGPRVLDVDFIATHTTGFEGFVEVVRSTPWSDLVAQSGLSQADLTSAAQAYIQAERVIGVYGMGLTQHTHGALNVAMVVNLLLLRGNIGRPGTGCCPVRGHSNVQGQRTVGLAEKTGLVPLDTLARQFAFTPPTKDGMAIVDAMEAVIAGEVSAFVSLGGNLLRAAPDLNRIQAAWPNLELSVMVSTALNVSHLHPGRLSYILPCLTRSERDQQASGHQAVSVEDSFSMISGSRGHRRPASPHLKSELAIVTGIAKATLKPHAELAWDAWTADYSAVRDLIETSYPKDFAHYNDRLFVPGGFHRPNDARERVWNTPSGRAVFTTPGQLTSVGFEDRPGRYRLITLRSNDQFNTTVYGYSDRYRGIEGTRDVLLISREDLAAAGLSAGQTVKLVTDRDDGHHRELAGLTLVAFDLPRGTVASYFPECNVLVPLDHHDQRSKTPASKSVPVRIEPV